MERLNCTAADRRLALVADALEDAAVAPQLLAQNEVLHAQLQQDPAEAHPEVSDPSVSLNTGPACISTPETCIFSKADPSVNYTRSMQMFHRPHSQQSRQATVDLSLAMSPCACRRAGLLGSSALVTMAC